MLFSGLKRPFNIWNKSLSLMKNSVNSNYKNIISLTGTLQGKSVTLTLATVSELQRYLIMMYNPSSILHRSNTVTRILIHLHRFTVFLKTSLKHSIIHHLMKFDSQMIIHQIILQTQFPNNCVNVSARCK